MKPVVASPSRADTTPLRVKFRAGAKLTAGAVFRSRMVAAIARQPAETISFCIFKSPLLKAGDSWFSTWRAGKATLLANGTELIENQGLALNDG